MKVPSLRSPTLNWEDHVMIDDDLPIRIKTKTYEDDVKLQIHSIPSDGAFLLSCQPPLEPRGVMMHTPCDIVLVIDVSGSMNTAAPMPDTGEADKEDNGLSILDLVKHSSRAIMENLNDSDRLGIVTFSDDAKVVQELTPMTDSRKEETRQRIEDLYDNGITNLWSGIQAGLKLLENANPMDNVQGLYVLTDGMPNHMCPKQGYVNKLKPMLNTMAEAKAKAGATMPTIHTFGFGYSIRSDLMQSIAEVGNGSYAFIPDAGMIGTVFVHAVANLFTTFAVSAMLEIETPAKFDASCAAVFNFKYVSNSRIQINLGNIQYGQGRDLYLPYNKFESRRPYMKATLTYDDRFGCSYSTYASPSTQPNSISSDLLAYHASRYQLCSHLSAFSPISAHSNEHAAVKDCSNPGGLFTRACSSLQNFITEITSSPYAADPKVASLIQDLTADEGESHGQISKAILATGNQQYYQKWGRHYLPSLLHAHTHQACNTFKDPGPLLYGTNSPQFINCRAELDKAFDNLPAPKPSRRCVGWSGSSSAPINMARYHRPSNPCFAGSCPVRLADGSLTPIANLKPGDYLQTPVGSRAVAALVRTDPPCDRRDRGQLCRIDDLWVTPWHPCHIGGKWTFPAYVAKELKECNEPVYSVLLDRDEDPEAHVIDVASIIGVTLGHGIVSHIAGQEDVRVHAFFGDYDKIVQSLQGLKRDDVGHLRCGGIERDEENGLACNFLPPKAEAGFEPLKTEIAQLSGWCTPSIPRIVVGAA